MGYDGKDCREAVREAATRLGKSPTVDEYRSLEIRPSVATFYEVAGGFADVKESVGLDVHATFRHDVNEQYFERVDRPEVAYWLGFLYGDGSVAKRDDGADGITVELHERDGAHLQKLKESLDADHSIGHRRNESSLCIYNDALVESLREHGLDEEKTHSASLPDVPTDNRAAFVRGLVDADGTFDRCNSGTITRVTIAGSSLRRFEKLSSWVPTHSTVYLTNDGRVYFRVTGTDNVVPFIRWLYPEMEETTPALERKVPVEFR